MITTDNVLSSKRMRISGALSSGVASGTTAAYATDAELWIKFHRRDESDDSFWHRAVVNIPWTVSGHSRS